MPGHHNDYLISAARRKLLRACFSVVGASLFASIARSQALPSGRLDVPYEPTPQPMVERMLAIAGVNAGDLLYDLGCGDGRIVITAAKKYGARGVGIDLDPQRIQEAQANARLAQVEDKVKFQVGDLFNTDFSAATVVTLFLWPHINRKLRPELWRQLRVGTRVVSYVWDMGAEWPPERTETINGKKIHYWTIGPEEKRLAAGI
ncbi:class I SAM-dependent methyltransferase [Oxalobacteraceae bacterium R-40]|uniref:Class I SAM-dependent methyltransferase n=1 Tax=Keguizhuia sedimenti TaxID=3064264 RepID=A0ABU1BSF2_9BURK|nr:class I SAM-dependent methyltransferase [Oxalobacteraceae bacterium R-40]